MSYAPSTDVATESYLTDCAILCCNKFKSS